MKYREVGSLFGEQATRFVVWAPEKKKAEVVAGNQRFLMNKTPDGYWQISIPGMKPGTLYKYSIDSQDPVPDPASRSQPLGVHGPSEVLANNFNWTDHEWKGLSLAEMILYELHVGTFTPEGTFSALTTKLDYLKKLGVNTIELMPVAQFPGERNWGYDGVFPFAVQHSYGGAEMLKRLVDEAHRKDIAVVLDVVYNHLGPEGNYLGHYGPYFTEKYKSVWGQALNFDDAWCDGVRNFFLQNALMWLRDFHIDGLRLDAVHAICDFSATHFIEELESVVRNLEHETGKRKVLIAEFDLNNPRYISDKSVGGYGLDGQWVDEFHHALHALVTRETDGYYEDFGTVGHLKKAITSGYVYTGEYSQHRKKHFGRSAGNAYSQFVVFAQNHDQVGNRLLGDRLTSALSFEQLKLVAAVYLLAPHVPMLFMGEEYGEKNPFQYFVSHTDEKLVEAVREGRKKEFSYFRWAGEIPDPQSQQTFDACKLSWSVEESQAKILIDYYARLIAIRKLPPWQTFTRDSLESVDMEHGHVVAFERIASRERKIILFNFHHERVTIPLPSRYSTIFFDSCAAQWAGLHHSTIANNKLTMEAESAIILEP